MKKHVRRSFSAGGVSQYIGIIVSITLLAHSTVLCSAEPQKGRLARAWGTTKEYVSKAKKRVGLNNTKEQARNRIKKYAGQAQTSLKKFVACLEGKTTCSREDIRKVRLYTAIVITAVTILSAAIARTVSQKQKEGEIEPKAPERAVAGKEEGGEEEKEEDPIKNIVEASKQDEWQPFFIAFERIYPKQKIDWKSEDGKAIAENVHRLWNKLPLKTKHNLQERGFLMTPNETEDLESIEKKEMALDTITDNIDDLLEITQGHDSVEIRLAMLHLNQDDYQTLKDFLEGSLSNWIHKNWYGFDNETKQALQKSAFVLNERERADIANIKEFQEEQAKAKKRAEAERKRLEIEIRSKAEAEKQRKKEVAEAKQRRQEAEERAEAEHKKEATPTSPSGPAESTLEKEPESEEEWEEPPEPENANGDPRIPEGEVPASMEVEEPKPPEPAAEGWGAWIARGVSDW